MAADFTSMRVFGKQLTHSLIRSIRAPIRSAGFDVKRYKPENSIPVQLQAVLAALSKFRQIELNGAHDADERYRFVDYCLANFHKSYSQIHQDLFVQYQSHDKTGGFFVEFGAGNGVKLSNTYMLEKYYQWNGILSEPARAWHADLKKSRSCKIDFRCVWNKSGERLQFTEAIEPGYSTLHSFSAKDKHVLSRQGGTRYSVDTVSLNDLLEQLNAPARIDYLSIDTEGSELQILSSFDFDRYDIRIITVEHNDTRQRAKIFSLLSSKGFVRTFEEFSLFDDWYVKQT